MQRYPATGVGGGVSNIASGGTTSRDTAKADSPFQSSNYSLNARRPLQVTPYKLTCDREPLNVRLGPPDYYPQTPNCPEETLSKEYVQHGYKETIDGLEEAREITLSQLGSFTKTIVVKCKEAIRKRLRAINESRAQKRKAGQVYGVPLCGSQLAKPCVFPEQRPCSEDFRKKWIEGLSQQHKRLRLLAEHVPHGYRRRGLFEVLIRHNVPLLRASWFMKVTCLNQVRPFAASVSSGAADQYSRSEFWTREVTDYLLILLEEFFPKDGSFPTQGKDQMPQGGLAGSVQHKGDLSSTIVDAEEPSLHSKWWYMVRILHWHHAEGLIIPSLLIEWVFRQLQDRDSLEALQLLLPIIFGVIETLALSQSYVRNLVAVALRYIPEAIPSGPDLVENSLRAYIVSALVEMLQYLILAVPDTFIALDCFPLPPRVLSEPVNGRNFILKASESAERVQYGLGDSGTMDPDGRSIVRYKSLSFDYLVSSIQKRSDNLAKAVNPRPQGRGVAKAVQALDKSLIMGDLREAYNLIFDDLFDECVEEGWIAEVSPCLRASLKWIETTSLSLACSIFFLCEWATCDFRDCRTAPPSDLKFTGRKDFSQVYLAVQLLKLHMEVSSNLAQGKSDSPLGSGMLAKCASQFDTISGGTTVEHVTLTKNKLKIPRGGFGVRDIFRSPGPVHDILVCWMDQHEIGKGEGFKRLELLLVELIHAGIFFPQAYARQLIVSGIMDRNETQVDLDRWKRHHQILKILPGPYLLDALKEARIAAVPVLQEAMRVYANERRLVLYGLSGGYSEHKSSTHISQRNKDNTVSAWGGTSPVSGDRWKNVHSLSASLSDRHAKAKPQVAEVKTAISIALNFPEFCSAFSDAHLEESLGTKRPIGLIVNKTDLMEGTDGCEECRRAKKQKTGEDRSLFQQGCSSNPSDDEDSWWLRKGHKSQDSCKVDPPLKPAKHAARNRQKMVRKTQSLAQLASARIEGSQGASTSHVCDNKNSCPHHRSGTEGEHPKSVDGIRTMQHGDIVKIGKVLKQLRLLEKRTITGWLMRSVMQLVEGTEKTVSNLGQSAGSFNLIDERCSVQWKLGEDELSAIIYLMDVASDIVSAIRFLLWLLSRLSNDHNSTIYSGRNTMMLSKNAEIYACDVGEAFLLSSIRRYENILISADLLPEVLSATMRRATLVLGSSGRASTSAAFIYARNLLKKYGNLSNVVKWEKNFKATCDPRLFTELESGRALDGEFGFSAGIPAGVEDPDVYCRQKIIGRLPRAGPSMKELVQHCFYGKERKLMTAGTPRSSGVEKSDDVYQRAQQIVLALTDCIRQNSGAAQEVDPSLVVSAISAIISNVCLAIAKLPDFTANSSYTKFPSAVSNLNSARRIVHIHTTCLFLLKEALGERYCRVFEIAFATEASLAIAGAFTPGKGSRSQFPEVHDSNANLSNEILNNSTQGALARATKAASAVSALVVGAVVQGVTSLERMVTVFRLKEGLDVVQLIKNARSSSNGMSRSIGTMKVDSSIEIVVHWFRLLIGNPRTVYDGLVVELLGEPCMLALARMQRMLPLSLIFPPAYSIFSLVIWRPYILNGNIVNREDVQVYQSLAMAIDGVIKHQPFRDVCLRDTRALYDNLTSDPADSEFAALLELHGLEKHMKTPFVPLRARHFLNALLDCRMPQSMLTQGNGDAKVLHAENEKKLTDQLVHVLDTLQPAKFHWQWVELRLLLNEQDLIEKVESPSTMSLAESIRSLSSNTDNVSRSEIGNNFSEMVLTRLLVRPDAAPLYSEVVHLLGKSQEESLLLHAKWFLAGPDVLYGRKSIRQRLTNVAQLRGLSTKVQFWKPWGWSTSDATANKIDKKVDASSLEEGEVVEDGLDFKRLGKMTSQMSDAEGFLSNQQYLTERALAELVLPCMDRSSTDSRTTFASDLIKQMNNIEQQISLLTGSASKQAGAVAIGVESTATKGNSRKGMRGGSPGLGKRSIGTADSAVPSTMALRASMWLRLQFLLRLLPVICSDRDPSLRSMRYMLASVILRLLGTRVLHEDANLSFYAMQSSNSEVELFKGGSAAVSLDNSGESLFDRFLSVLYGLLGGCKPSWLKPKAASKFSVKSPREFAALDGELAEKLQIELDRMELPETIRWRIQAAMPVLARFNPSTISCQPPSLSAAAIASLQSSISAPAIPPGNSNASHRNSVSLPRIASTTTPGKPKMLPLQDQEMEIDPWMVLEDGTGSCPSSSNSNVGVGGETANLKACNWLKGAVRVRRTDLTYIGAVDEDN